MSDATTINSHTEETSSHQNNAVASKILHEINVGMTPSFHDRSFEFAHGDIKSLGKASDQVGALVADPTGKGVLEALALKVDSHDPALCLVSGSVERDKEGNITGFEFESPAQIASFHQEMHKIMDVGVSYQMAFTGFDDHIDDVHRGSLEGYFHLDATSTQ